jgi:hypothetical protein
MPEYVTGYWNDQIAAFEAAKAKYGAEIKPGDFQG